MTIDVCALCGETRELQLSHFLPAGLYRLVFDPDEKNGHPILMSRTTTMKSTFQMKYPLLCRDCEGKFSANGERYVIPRLQGREGFRFLDELRDVPAHQISPELFAFSCADAGFDAGKLAYFAVSLLWRAAVRNWDMFDGHTTSVQMDDGHKESIRQYLLGTGPFPSDMIVMATVATDVPTRESFFTPSRIPENPYTTYSVMTKGLAFRISMGSDLPLEMKSACCIHNGIIFAKDCSDRSVDPFVGMMETSVVKGGMARELDRKAS
jgi:hypothetical protein